MPLIISTLILLVLVIRKIAANGSLTTVARIGDIRLGPNLTLKNVLHVPKLSTKLVSMTKISQDLNCKVTFFFSNTLIISGSGLENDDWMY